MTVEAVGEIAAARLTVLGTADDVPPAVLSASVGSEWVEGRIIEWYSRFGVAIAVAFAVAASVYILFIALLESRLPTGPVERLLASIFQ